MAPFFPRLSVPPPPKPLRHFIKLLTTTSPNPLVHLHGCTSLTTLLQIHALLTTHGYTTQENLRAQTKLLTSYAALGDTMAARKMLDQMPHPDPHAYKAMLARHVAAEQYAEAVALYKKMSRSRRFRQEDNVVLSLALKACVKSLDFDEGKKLHCRVLKAGDGDCYVLNSLVDMYAKAGDLDYSRRVFDRILDRNVVSWTSMVSGYVKNGYAEDGMVLFNEMRSTGVVPSEYTVVSLLAACSMLGALHQGRWIHGRVIKDGVIVNAFLGAALLDMYVKCGEVGDARSVFDGLGRVDLVSWTAMIVGYTQKGHPLEALRLFCNKKFMSIVPNSVTMATVLSASARLQNLNLGRSIHGTAIKLGVAEYDVVMNALVDMYAKCCAVPEASRIFDRIEKTDVVAWNSMIAGYAQNELAYQALSLLNQMRTQGSSPDAISVVSALSACASLGDPHIGKSFHAYAAKCALMSNVYVNTAILNLYNKCADLASAQRVFDEMSDRNTVTWCAMIGGYGMQGDSISSADLFSEMLKDNVQPNDVVFTSILSTCSHAGMVSLGKKYFDSMSQHYNVIPSMKHYACMVDVLARAGKLEEALEFIEKMPMQADISVWGAFLHGCRLHSRLEFGEVAIRRMMDLRPETPDYYVLMSNLYTSYGRWDKSLAIRGLMQERGLVKLPGCSSVGLENG